MAALLALFKLVQCIPTLRREVSSTERGQRLIVGF